MSFFLPKFGGGDADCVRFRLASVQGEWHELETKRERAKKRKKD